MLKTVVINLGDGCLDNGFRVIVRLLENDKEIEQWTASLPACPQLANSYKKIQNFYISLYEYQILRSRCEEDMDGFEIQKTGVTNVSKVYMDEEVNGLKNLLNQWLSEREFSDLEKKLRAKLNENEDILVVIENPDTQEILQRLPWDLWDLFKSYKKAGYALRRQEFQQNPSVQSDQIRILTIFGDTTDINVDAEQQFIRELNNVECEFLVPTSRQEIFEKITDEKGWDILFFAGHSNTENNRGIMYFINGEGTPISLSIEEFSNAFDRARRRLKLAIFNSCNGLGLAFDLGKLNIPATIFMREPVPNKVAEEFFRHFLKAFARKHLPLHLAVREAKESLQGLEHDFPAASLLPLLYQQSTSILTWEQFILSKGINSSTPDHRLSTVNYKKITVALIGLVSVIAILFVVFETHAEKRLARLASELNNQEWSKANKTTDDILYKLINIENPEEVINGNTKVNDEKISKIPCDILKQIDNLWIGHSNGKFSFSIQAKIWEITKQYKGDPWDNFADKVGWRENYKWLGHHDFSSYAEVNKGYLPTFILARNGNVSWNTFFKRLKECKLGSRLAYEHHEHQFYYDEHIRINDSNRR